MSSLTPPPERPSSSPSQPISQLHLRPRPRPHAHAQPQPRSNKRKREDSQETVGAGENDVLETTPMSTSLFLNMPAEIHLRILNFLDSVDGVCFGLVSKKLYNLLSPIVLPTPLSSGSPTSSKPHPQAQGCRHCVPVLYSPAHCELHFHIRSFFPARSTYCSNCDRFTVGQKGSKEGDFCGNCGISYRRRFRRGRRIVDLEGRRQRGVQRGNRWFNSSG